MSTHQLILLTTIASFALTAVAYYRGWAYIAVALAVAYFGQNVWLAWELVWPEMPVLFCFAVALGAAFPIVLIVLFAIDVWFGAFVLDMAYGMAFAWLVSPLLFFVNLLAYFLGGATP